MAICVMTCECDKDATFGNAAGISADRGDDLRACHIIKGVVGEEITKPHDASPLRLS